MAEVTWTSMNENLMALLEAVLTLAASDTASSAPRRSDRPGIKPGGFSEDIFLDLTEEELDEYSCSICYQVLKDAMQCMNQHKFCHSCVYVWSTTGQYANRVRCPVCRCHGYYLRNDDLDEKIGKKKVKCSMEGCRWTGPLKYLSVHRHTNYGSIQSSTARSSLLDNSDDEDEEEEGGSGRGSVLELPYLGRAPPRLPHRNQSRFNGTGLRARAMITTVGAAAAAADAVNLDDSNNPTVHTTTSRLDSSTASASPPVGGGGGILLRERRNTGTSMEPNSSSNAAPPQRLTVRQRVHPIRRGPNRIMVAHTDNNNNLAGVTAATASSSNSSTGEVGEEGNRRSMFSPEGILASTPRQPRPPSGPRPPSHRLRRNLPGLVNTGGAGTPRPTGDSLSHRRAASPAAHVIRAPPTFNADSVQDERHQHALGAFQNRLRESRNRLEGLMSNFSTELERSRQEMADFQVERERQRREQLTEVRELGRRLGQVANELRHLLNHRRIRPSESSESSDE